MTLEEARIKAEQPATQADGTVNKETYAIQFEQAESAKSLIGKKLMSLKAENKNYLEVVEWIGQNYVLRTNGADYSVAPVVYILSKTQNMKVI